MHSLFALYSETGDVRTGDGQRQMEFLVLDFDKPGRLDPSPCLAVRVATISQPFPQRTDQRLPTPGACSGGGGYVLDEHESAAGLQNADHLTERGCRITDGAKDQSADNGIDACIERRQRLCDAGPEKCGDAGVPADLRT